MCVSVYRIYIEIYAYMFYMHTYTSMLIYSSIYMIYKVYCISNVVCVFCTRKHYHPEIFKTKVKKVNAHRGQPCTEEPFTSRA